MSEHEKKFLEMIKADGLGQVPDNIESSYLPKEIADKIIKQLLEENWVRRMFPKISVPTAVRNLSIPAIIHGANNVRTIGYGEDVTAGSEQTVSTKAVVVSPRLLVTYVDVIEDDLETAGVDLARTIRESLTTKLAEAEERAMLFGVYSASTGVYSNVFNGIYTIAAGSDCATSPVTYTVSDKKAFKIMDAKKELGVYGRNPSNLVLLCSATFANALRKEDVTYSQNYRADTDVLKTGSLPPIAGVKVIETTHLDEKESGEVALLVRTDSFLVADRKRVFFRTDEIVEKFTKRLIIAEELDFKPQLINGSDKYEGAVLIHKAS